MHTGTRPRPGGNRSERLSLLPKEWVSQGLLPQGEGSGDGGALPYLPFSVHFPNMLKSRGPVAVASVLSRHVSPAETAEVGCQEQEACGPTSSRPPVPGLSSGSGDSEIRPRARDPSGHLEGRQAEEQRPLLAWLRCGARPTLYSGVSGSSSWSWHLRSWYSRSSGCGTSSTFFVSSGVACRVWASSMSART